MSERPLTAAEVEDVRSRISRLREARMALGPGDVLDARFLATLDEARAGSLDAATLRDVLDYSMPTHSVTCAGQDDDAQCICGTADVMERAYAALREAQP